MDSERVCGTCIYGGDAYDRYGNIDPNYVICQIKEAENRQRKPDRYQTSSGVSRMHYYREACLHWKVDRSKTGEYDLPQVPAQPDPLDYEEEWRPPVPLVTPSRPTSQVDDEEHKRLKLQVIQQDQMLTSLRNQTQMLSDQVHDLQQELAESKRRLEALKPFDIALFAEVNHFSLLGVSEQASSDEIKEAYRTRMKHLHPDRFINIAQRLNTAYEILMHPEKRSKYLQQIRGKQGHV